MKAIAMKNNVTANIFDLTKIDSIPVAHDYQTSDNEFGRPITAADYFDPSKPYHFARVELDNIIIDESTRLWERDDSHIDELAVSIENDGLIVPIGVKWRDDNDRAGKYRTPVVDLVYGYHRLAALKKLRDKYGDAYGVVSCLVYSPKLKPAHIKRMEAIENLKRRIPTGDERKSLVAELDKNKAGFLVAVLEYLTAPVATGKKAGQAGKNGAAAGEMTLAAAAKTVGRGEDWLRDRIKDTAKALGVTDYNNADPQKREQLANAVSVEINDNAGKSIAAKLDRVKQLDAASQRYVDYVKRTALSLGKHLNLAEIEAAEDPLAGAIVAASELKLVKPSTFAHSEIENEPTRLAARILNDHGYDWLVKLHEATAKLVKEYAANA